MPTLPVEVGAIGIESEPVTLIGSVLPMRGRFENRGAFVHLVEHGDLEDFCAGNFGVVGLAPEELAA